MKLHTIFFSLLPPPSYDGLYWRVLLGNACQSKSWDIRSRKHYID